MNKANFQIFAGLLQLIQESIKKNSGTTDAYLSAELTHGKFLQQ